MLVDEHAADVGVGADLRAVRERVGHVRDQRRRLCIDLAALQAKASVDAMRPVAEAAVGDRHRADPHGDPEPFAPVDEHVAVARHRLSLKRVAVRITPRPWLAGDWQLLLDLFVVRPQLVVRDGPVRADAVVGEGREVGRMEARRVAGVVHHRSADAAPRVVRTHRHRIRAADESRIGPVERVRTALVAYPVGFRIPERAGIERDDAPPRAGQPLRQRSRRRRRSRRWRCRPRRSRRSGACRRATGAGIRALSAAAKLSRCGRARRRALCIGHFERLAFVEPHVLVAARIRRPRESRSRSRPTGVSRTPCMRIGSTATTPGSPADRATAASSGFGSPARSRPVGPSSARRSGAP